MGAFVGVDHFQVHQVTDHAELVGDAVAAEHVAGQARDIQGLAAGVALHQRGDFHGGGAVVLHAAQAQAALQAQGDFGLHVGQFFLDQLVGGQRAAELLAVQGVLASLVPAVLGGAQRAPGNAVTGGVEAGERTFQAGHVRQHVLFRHEHIVHHDFTGDGRAQAHLAVDRRGGQTVPAFFQNKAADLAVFGLAPHHEHVGDRAVGDPHLVAGEAVAAVHFLGAGGHAARVGAVVRLGQAETADPLAAGQLGQVFLLLLFAAEFIDRHHHQGRLHAHHGAVAGIHPLHFPGDQAVAHIVHAGAAVGFRDGGAEQAQLAHFAEDFRVGFLMAEGFQDTRRQLVLGVLLGGLAHHALVFGELLVQQQRAGPIKGSVLCHGIRPLHSGLSPAGRLQAPPAGLFVGFAGYPREKRGPPSND